MESRFVPLGITIADDGYGCVAAIDEHQQWIRPEPILASDVSTPETPYHCFTWIRAELGESIAADPRIEDRNLTGRPEPLRRLDPVERTALIARVLDPDVECSFAGNRTLGLVKVTVERVYVWEWRKQSFVRAVFQDASGARHDWLVPDYRFRQTCLPAGLQPGEWKQAAERLTRLLATSETYFAVSLTRQDTRFPGKVRGCHPLVVGVHSEPDYSA